MKTKIIILMMACMVNMPSLSDSLNPIQLDLAKRILADKNSPLQSRRDARVVLDYYSHKHPHSDVKKKTKTKVKKVKKIKNTRGSITSYIPKRSKKKISREIVISAPKVSRASPIKSIHTPKKPKQARQKMKTGVINYSPYNSSSSIKITKKSNNDGIYKNVAALNIIKDLIPTGWKLELDEVTAKLKQTKVNYYTEKSSMESIGEIVTALGLKMKIFNRLKVIIITK